jgi:hypothetical protein
LSICSKSKIEPPFALPPNPKSLELDNVYIVNVCVETAVKELLSRTSCDSLGELNLPRILVLLHATKDSHHQSTIDSSKAVQIEIFGLRIDMRQYKSKNPFSLVDPFDTRTNKDPTTYVWYKSYFGQVCGVQGRSGSGGIGFRSVQLEYKFIWPFDLAKMLQISKFSAFLDPSSSLWNYYYLIERQIRILLIYLKSSFNYVTLLVCKQ